MKLQRGKNLFRVLRDVCDYIALESDMDEIVKAVEADNAANSSNGIQPVIKRYSKCDYCNDSGAAPFKTSGKCPICQ